MNLPICKLKPLSFAVILGLTACGGGGSDTPATTTTTTTTTGTLSSGIFLDAEVGGLSYTTSSGVSGTTDSNGTYTYNTGDTITFNVGGVGLGTVPGAPSCTPLDFGAASTNIARFIQSLDADGIPGNGIDLSAAATALAGVTVSSSSFASATFAPEILAAIGTASRTDIGEAAALANLAAGTTTTFSNADIENQLFVAIDPTDNDIGIISFDSAAAGTEFEIFASDTTAAGGDGLGTDATWTIDGSGVLFLTDITGGAAIPINRLGGSSRSISTTFIDDITGATLPATLLIPQAITLPGLGGNGTTVTSKTYDVVDIDGTALTVTFNSDGTFTASDATGPIDNGPYLVGADAPNLVTINSANFTTDVTFLVILDAGINTTGQTVSVLLADATAIGVDSAGDPILEFNSVGIGSVTLKP